MAKRGGKRRDPAQERCWRRTIQGHERIGLTIAATISASAFRERGGWKEWTFRRCWEVLTASRWAHDDTLSCLPSCRTGSERN
jgi:hypothetical protein